MYLRAVIGRKGHTEYGVATIPFPIKMNSYEHDLYLLEAMEIGDALKADCYIEKIESDVPVLKLLEGQEVNFDELDYLAKRLDSFDENEIAQFQAATHKLSLTKIRDFIPFKKKQHHL